MTRITSALVVAVPLHQQALAWGVKSNVSVVQLPDNRMFFKWVSTK